MEVLMFLVFIAGLILGAIFTMILSRMRTIGALRVDRSDPEDGPYLFLELTSGPEVIQHKKYITLKVDTRSYISQK